MSQNVNVNEVTINGVTYVQKGTNSVEYNGDIKIVVLQRGWVMIGRFERNGSDCKLHQASVIRSWGTKKGLGELATEGKKKDTILDPCGGVVEFDNLTVVCTISVNEALWKKEL